MFFQNKKREDIDFPKEITLNNSIFFIEIIFSKKKSSSVSFEKTNIKFRLSSYLSNKEALEHFNSLLNRITPKIQNQVNENFKTTKEILEKGEFKFANQKYYIEYTKTRGVKLKENIFYVNFQMNHELVEKYLIHLLIKKYTPRIQEYVNQLNNSTYNYSIKSIELKYVKSKWGHCTHDNKLMFNFKLLNADPSILDYVIFHEIAHIKHKNHSSNFWNEVARFCPNHKNLRKKLKDNSPSLFY